MFSLHMEELHNEIPPCFMTVLMAIFISMHILLRQDFLERGQDSSLV